MQQPWTGTLLKILAGEPTVGSLMALCEDNYRLLMRMAPDLADMQGRYASCLGDHTDLYLEVLEQARYTTLIHLTYYFHHEQGQTPDPDVTLRVYHDARQVEVLDLRQRVLPMQRLYDAPALLNKWKANLFVSKWLSFCNFQGHYFSADEVVDEA
jgi:uncharacterized protein YqiB (DUF1249 family)